MSNPLSSIYTEESVKMFKAEKHLDVASYLMSVDGAQIYYHPVHIREGRPRPVAGENCIFPLVYC